MNLDSYLYQPKLNPNLSDGQRAFLKALQAHMDQAYKEGPGGLHNYFEQGQLWIDNNVRMRSESADPDHYTPTSFVMRVPERAIVDYDDAGVIAYRSETDPSIHPPALPAYVKPAPIVVTGFVSTRVQADAVAAAKDQLMFSTLAEQGKKLDALMQFFGVKVA